MTLEDVRNLSTKSLRNLLTEQAKVDAEIDSILFPESQPVEIKLNVQRTGKEPGTVGWLAERAATLKVGTLKNRTMNRGVWLLDKDGRTMTVLCIEDWLEEGDGTYKATRKAGDRQSYPDELEVDFSCTDACWAKLKEIIDFAATLLDEPEEMADQYRVVFTNFHKDTPANIVSDWLKERNLIPEQAVVAG